MAQQIFVTVPGLKKEPITIPDAATVSDFCREVFHRTGVSLFGGFGYKGMNASGVVALTSQQPLTPKAFFLPVPAAPVLTISTASGTLSANTYFVKITYTSLFGETLASGESSIVLPAAGNIVVASPSATVYANGWNVYISTATGTETKQNGATPLAISANYTQAGALTGGASLPTSNTAVTTQDAVSNATLNFSNFLLPAPVAPTTATATTGGSVTAATYLVTVTYVNPTGETVASASSSQVTTGSTSTITVTSPAPSGDATGYNVYIGTATPKLQNGGTPVAIGANFTQTAAVSTVTVVSPASNTANSPVNNNTPFLSLGISNGDELFVFNTPVGG